ncbi:hypothetical protein IVB45_02135 [Bradyrhizobium sp. 4]|uniref:hypothetical protein n=1 Tax=Bradyrhizobium sp. 4 TaxID=2782678 RepID=UPI001FFF3BDC|nr:hypothetical protein [Bradyrhizobium sp. 4]UPJ35833.1 hypothetical protein IVB45_02135 [Bradyrhizobium sp. 4]
MAAYFEGYSTVIHSIPAEIMNDMMECVQVTKTYGSEDNIKEADRVEAYILLYKKTLADEQEKSALFENLTVTQEEQLKEAHAKNYHGTDDDMSDAYEAWLENLTLDELKDRLK